MYILISTKKIKVGISIFFYQIKETLTKIIIMDKENNYIHIKINSSDTIILNNSNTFLPKIRLKCTKFFLKERTIESY
jgi:hypothetical protein